MEAPQPREPLSLAMASLFDTNNNEKDRKIQKHITDHCSHCSSFREDNLHLPSSQCEDQLCGYFYWFYRHYLLKHKRSSAQNTEQRSTCNNCCRLHRWMSAHSAECLTKPPAPCCLSLCHEMKKHLHLSKLGKIDHDFIRRREGTSPSPQPHTSLGSQNSNYTTNVSSSPSLADHTPSSYPHSHYQPNASTPVQQSGHIITRSSTYSSHTPLHSEEHMLQSQGVHSASSAGFYRSPEHSKSSTNFDQRMRHRQMPTHSDFNSRSYTNILNGQPGNNATSNGLYSLQNGYQGTESHHRGHGVVVRTANVNTSHGTPGEYSHLSRQAYASTHTPAMYDRYNGTTPGQDYGCEDTPPTCGEMCNREGNIMSSHGRMNGGGSQMNGALTMPMSVNTLGTPTNVDLKLSRQYSYASSGYGTASSTGRQSVVSNPLSRDQSMTELDPENSLQVLTKPQQRKSSAPAAGGFVEGSRNSRQARRLPAQQSQSLTNLEHMIPESPGTPPEVETNILNRLESDSGEYERESSPTEIRLSLQRQDTNHETKVVFCGSLESSIKGSEYQAMMEKGKMDRKQRIEETGTSPSPPVTKRPLQREESDVSSAKIVLSSEEYRVGSNSLTRESYDSIFKFREQRGILSDPKTREVILGKQRKQAASEDRRMRQGTLSSDVQSDFDTESSTSDIPGSSPLTSGEFSEMDQDLNDQDEEKKVSETQTRVTEVIERGMTVEEQIQMIKSKTMRPLPVNTVNIPQSLYSGRMKNLPKSIHGISLPPEMSPTTYTPSAHPLQSLPQGNAFFNTSSSSIGDGLSTLESDRFSSNTLKEEEHFTSNRFSGEGGGPVTLSSTDGSTLTGGSFEGKFTSLRLSSGASSGRNEDTKGMVNSSAPHSLHTPQSGSLGRSMRGYLMQGGVQGEIPTPSSSMEFDSERTSYYMQNEEDSKLMSLESDTYASPSPAPPPFLPRKYKLPSSHVEEIFKTVDDVKEKYHDELLRIRHKGQLIKQEIPDLSEEEKRRKVPGFWYYGDKHGDSITGCRGNWCNISSKSDFPELEKKYYHETLSQQFPVSQEEISRDVERRNALRSHLLGKFHSGNAYREGIHWNRKTKLGKGGQAECYSILDDRTGLLMALKEEKEDEKTLDEAYVCMKLSSLSNASQNIVDYYCAAMLPKEYHMRGIPVSLIQVFMEMVPACLHAYLHDNGPFGIEDLHHFGYQLFDALDYLHSTLRIIHCDVKPANLLLDYTAQRLKLTDFGFSQLLDQYSNEVQGDENAGTLSYNPPEHYRERKCSFALDIWQAGCTLLTMATTRRPWRHLFMDVVRRDQSPQFVKAVRRGQANLIGQQTGGHMYPFFLDESLKKLLHGCLHPDPKSRLSAQDCVYLLAMAATPHMNEEHQAKINKAFGYWRSPPPVLGTYKQDTQYIDVYLETTRHVTVDGTKFSLSPGWLGCVPYQEGMTFELMEKETLRQHFPVMQHLTSVKLTSCENSPQSIFMKTAGHPVDLNFEPATPQSPIDRTKAIVILNV